MSVPLKEEDDVVADGGEGTPQKPVRLAPEIPVGDSGAGTVGRSKSRAQAAAGSAIMVIVSRTLSAVVSLGAVYFYTRHLAKSDLALSLVAGLLGELCYLFGDFGLGLSLERRLPAIIAANREDGLAMIGVCMYVLVITAIISCLLLFLFADFISTLLLKDDGYRALLLAAIPFIGSVVWRNFMFALMRGVNAYGRLSVLSLSSQVLYAGLTIAGFLLDGMRGFLVGAFLGYALPSLYESWVLRTYLGRPPGLRQFREYLGMSAPYCAERYLNYSFYFADQWAIGLFLTPAALATYYVPRNFFDRLNGLLDAFWMVPTTVLSRESARGLEVARGAMQVLRKFFVYVFIPLGVGLAASSYCLIQVLAGNQYLDAAVPFAILAIFFTISGAFAASPVGLTVLAPPKERLKMIIAQNGVYLLVLPLLAMFLGLHGVAMARVVGTVTGSAVAWFLLDKFMHSWARGGALKTVIPPSIALLAIVAGGQYVYYSLFVVPFYMMLGAAVYVLIFFAIVPIDDLKMLESLLPDRLRFVAQVGLRMRQR